MAISKKGLRKIEVNGEIFFWKIKKKVSWDEKHCALISIPIFHESEGQLLSITLGFTRGYFKPNEFLITPKMISNSIVKALDVGWKFKEQGKPFELDCSDVVELNQD